MSLNTRPAEEYDVLTFLSSIACYNELFFSASPPRQRYWSWQIVEIIVRDDSRMSPGIYSVARQIKGDSGTLK